MTGVAFFDADDRMVICTSAYEQIFAHLRQLGELKVDTSRSWCGTAQRTAHLHRGDACASRTNGSPRGSSATAPRPVNRICACWPTGGWLQTVESRTATAEISGATDMTPAKQAENAAARRDREPRCRVHPLGQRGRC